MKAVFWRLLYNVINMGNVGGAGERRQARARATLNPTTAGREEPAGRSHHGLPPLLAAEVSLGLNAANMTFPLILYRLFRI